MLAAGALAAAGGIGFAATTLLNQPPDDFAALGRGIDNVVLTNSQGEQVRWGALRGAPRAVFFGFTHCPVICPVTVYELTAAADRLGALADQLRIDFVTVDPARDTPEHLRTYFSGFGPKVTGFTGSEAVLSSVMQSFDVTATRTDEGNGAYGFDHTATAFLIDRAGRVRDGVIYGAEPAVMEERLRALLSR